MTMVFILWIVIISLEQKKLEWHWKVCENKTFFHITMPSEDPWMLEFDQYHKSDKAPSIIYVDCECLVYKFDGCKYNPKNDGCKYNLK